MSVFTVAAIFSHPNQTAYTQVSARAARRDMHVDLGRQCLRGKTAVIWVISMCINPKEPHHNIICIEYN